MVERANWKRESLGTKKVNVLGPWQKGPHYCRRKPTWANLIMEVRANRTYRPLRGAPISILEAMRAGFARGRPRCGGISESVREGEKWTSRATQDVGG